MKTDAECKKIITDVAWELKISPRLISMRLLNEEDKQCIRIGEVGIVELKCHVEAWMASGMPNYASGSTKLMIQEKWDELQ